MFRLSNDGLMYLSSLFTTALLYHPVVKTSGQFFFQNARRQKECELIDRRPIQT